MTPTPRRRQAAAQKLAELSLAVPQVVGHRVARMAAAGPWPGARDRHEFHAMGAEKIAAFGESWLAILMQLWRTQWALAASLSAWWWSPARWMPTAWMRTWTPGAWPAAVMPRAEVWQRWARNSALALEHGLTPVHRRAVANARRLGRLKKG